MRIEDLSVNERILIHLRDYSMDPINEGAAMGQTQEGIGEAIGIRINHVPRATKKLLDDIYIDEALVHIGGLKRKRKAYFLLKKGKKIADDLVDEFRGQKVLFRDSEGNENLVAIDELIFKARTITPSIIILTYFNEEVLLESSLEGKDEFPYVSTLDAVPEPEIFVDRENEMAHLKKSIDGDKRLLVVSGIKGIGKTSLVWKVLKDYEGSKNIMWYTAHDWDSARSVVEALSDFYVRLGRNEMKKMLRVSKDLDIGMSAGALLKDVQDSDSIVVIDNVFDLKREVMQLLHMICENSRNTKGTSFILITRDREGLMASPCLGDLGGNDLVVKGLDHEKAMEFMSQLGMEPDESERVYAMTQGHPLALKLVNSEEIDKVIDTKGLTKEEVWVVRCLKAFDAIFE
ncbi:MAG: hypothetical protein KAJ33_01610 [Thermoplasmata archaeon]|nr:hypothetical protein [Thermoplasmata archaeon]